MMSTEIKSIYGGASRLSLTAREGNVFAYLPHATVTYKDVGVDRGDFLAAVETECGVRMVPADAIVIARAELPEVTKKLDYPDMVFVDGAPYGLDIDARWLALDYLALAEYLDAHPPVPPVDEADVDYITGLLMSDQSGDWRADARAVARRLLATGRVSVTP